MNTELFKSWADIGVMLLLAIAYIITFVVQKNLIKAKNETIEDLKVRNQELERTAKASLGVASERTKDVEVFKEMYNPELLKQYVSMNIKVEVDKIKNSAEKQAAEDKEMLKTMELHLNEGVSYIAYMLHVERKYTREQRIQFFHTYFRDGRDLFWYMSNQKIELIEKQKSLTESGSPDGSNIPRGKE